MKTNHYAPSITIEDFLAAEASDASISANVCALHMISLAAAPYVDMILACKPFGIIVFLLLLHN